MAIGKQGSSSWSVLLVDGYNFLAAKVKGFSDEVEILTKPSEGLGDSWREHTPINMRQATLTQEGAFFDTTTNSIQAAMAAVTAAVRIVMWAPASNAIGAIFKACQGAYTSKYGVLAREADLVQANVEYTVSGQLDEGLIIQEHAARTADWNTKTDGNPVDYTADPSQVVIPITSNTLANPSVVTTPIPHGLTTGDIILISGVITSNPTINGERTVTVISPTTFSVPVNVTTAGTGGSFVRSNTSFGAVGYQGVSAFSGFTGFVGKLRDSPDNVTYADLLSFPNVTSGPQAQRVTVAGVVDRYMSFDGDVTGSGSITVFAGLKRNAS